MKLVIACASLLLAATLAGCSDPDSNTGGAPPEPAPSPSPSWDCITNWDDEHCGQPGEAPSSDLPQVDQGQPFQYTSQRPDIDSGELEVETVWKVTLADVECGIKALPNAASTGRTYKPLYKTAKPGPGGQFCLLQWDWENVGNKPGTTNLAGSLIADGVEFAKSEEDKEYSQNWMYHEYGYSQSEANDINPGGTTKTADVYTLPEVSEATAVLFPEPTLVYTSVVQVNLS